MRKTLGQGLKRLLRTRTCLNPLVHNSHRLQRNNLSSLWDVFQKPKRYALCLYAAESEGDTALALRTTSSAAGWRTERTVIEVDMTYAEGTHSGIATYTRALIYQLHQRSDFQVRVLHAGRVQPGDIPAGVEARPKQLLDKWRVRSDATRLIPHHFRLSPVGRSIVVVHDVIHLGLWTPRLKRWVFRALLGVHRVRGVRIMAVSHYTRSRLLSAGFNADRVVVAHPSLPPSNHRHTTEAREKQKYAIIYVGNLRVHKDVRTLVKAFDQIVERVPATLHIVSSDRQEVIDRLLATSSPSARARIQVHHRSSDDERDALISAASVAVTCSLEEGYGYAIDEAVALGTAVAASRIPAHLETSVTRDGVMFFAPGDVGDLAETILSFFEGRTSRANAQSDSHDSVALAIARLIND